MSIYEEAIAKLEQELEIHKMIFDIIMCLDEETYIDSVQKIINLLTNRIEKLDSEFKELKEQF